MDIPITHIRKVAGPGEYRMKCVRCKRFVPRKNLKLSVYHNGKVCKNVDDCEKARKERDLKRLEEIIREKEATK